LLGIKGFSEKFLGLAGAGALVRELRREGQGEHTEVKEGEGTSGTFHHLLRPRMDLLSNQTGRDLSAKGLWGPGGVEKVADFNHGAEFLLAGFSHWLQGKIWVLLELDPKS
jgi:hypothetical protein